MPGTHKIRRSAEEQAKLQRALTGLFERHISFNQFLGLKLEFPEGFPETGSARLRIEMRKELQGHALSQRLHGGVTASVLDTMGGLGIICAICEKHCDESTAQIMNRFTKLGTIDLRTDFLQQGVGQSFVASAKVVRLGGRIASVQMSLESDDGTLVATGSGSYIVS
jgi:uncharacterized protein (TIGR00369 family)